MYFLHRQCLRQISCMIVTHVYISLILILLNYINYILSLWYSVFTIVLFRPNCDILINCDSPHSPLWYLRACFRVKIPQSRSFSPENLMKSLGTHIYAQFSHLFIGNCTDSEKQFFFAWSQSELYFSSSDNRKIPETCFWKLFLNVFWIPEHNCISFPKSHFWQNIFPKLYKHK